MVISRKSLLPKLVLLKHAASTAMYIIRHYHIAIHAASGIFFRHVQIILKILCNKIKNNYIIFNQNKNAFSKLRVFLS